MTVHVHILGIAGTFMGGLAAIAKAAGFRVTGSDLNVYPPMSTQLEALGIEVTAGFDAEQLALAPDVVVVGNVMTRGMPVIEALTKYRRETVIAIGLKLTEVAWVGILTVFAVTYLTQQLGMQRSVVLDAITLATLIELSA